MLSCTVHWVRDILHSIWPGPHTMWYMWLTHAGASTVRAFVCLYLVSDRGTDRARVPGELPISQGSQEVIGGHCSAVVPLVSRVMWGGEGGEW